MVGIRTLLDDAKLDVFNMVKSWQTVYHTETETSSSADAEIARRLSCWMQRLLPPKFHIFDTPMVFFHRIQDHRILQSGQLWEAGNQETDLMCHTLVTPSCFTI